MQSADTTMLTRRSGPIFEPLCVDVAFGSALKWVRMSDLGDRSMSQPKATDCAAFRQAILLHRQGRLREAATYYQAALQVDQNHFDSLHNLGVIQLQLGKPAEAAKQIIIALKINPNSAEARITWAVH
jgi:tetratricopeptide (TPR) repeat protein